MNKGFFLYLAYPYLDIKPVSPTIIINNIFPTVSFDPLIIGNFSGFLKHLIIITLICPWGLEKSSFLQILTLVRHLIAACIDWSGQY